MLVRFFISNYAPCMVQAEIINRRFRARVVRHVIANGGPEEDTALLSWEDIEMDLRPAQIKDLQAGWDVIARIDDFTALTYYGYDANTLR